MAGNFKSLAVCSCLLAAAWYLGAAYGASEDSVLGHLASISADMQLEVFAVNCSTASSEYVIDIQLDQDDPISLRPPCPSCSPTYNQLTLASTPHQTFIPVPERLIVTSIINDQPYAQLVRMDGCDPISMLKPKSNSDLLYMQCRNSGTSRTLYQLARLMQNPEDLQELQWSFQFYDAFDDFTSEGEYYEYYDGDRYEVMFMYSKIGKLFFEGPDNGYYRFFALPDDCATTVRLTPITDTNHRIIIECSDAVQSDTIRSVYAFNPETGDIATILSNVEYSKCPIRFSKDGSVIAIFTEREVLVTNHMTTDSVLARVPVQGTGVVYDGLLTSVEGVTYAIYSTQEGLFTFSVSQALQGGNGATAIMAQSSDICAEEGCPLLVLVEDNRVLATLDHEIAMFSINPPRPVNRVTTTYQTARFIFQERFLPPPSPPPTSSQPAPWATSHNQPPMPSNSHPPTSLNSQYPMYTPSNSQAPTTSQSPPLPSPAIQIQPPEIQTADDPDGGANNKDIAGKSGSHVPVGMIVGIVIGVGVIVIAVGLLVACAVVKKKCRRNNCSFRPSQSSRTNGSSELTGGLLHSQQPSVSNAWDDL